MNVTLASGESEAVIISQKQYALGADGVQVGQSDLIALTCERLGVCEEGDGCRLNYHSNPDMACLVDSCWARDRIVNLRHAGDCN